MLKAVRFFLNQQSTGLHKLAKEQVPAQSATTVLPLSDLPEDLLVLESRNEGEVLQEKDEQEPFPSTNDVVQKSASSRFTFQQNHVIHKLKKVYFDRLNSQESCLDLVLKGESVGVLVGSIGVCTEARNHPILVKLAAEIRDEKVSESLESVHIYLGRFAITDAKLMDLNSERNVALESFVEKEHVTQQVSLAQVKDILDVPSLTSLSSCTILYFKSSSTVVGKVYLIDIKDPDFGMSHQDTSSSSISLTSLQGKLRESMLKISDIAKILGNAGSEGALDFNFPLGVCCREMFGGKAHAYVSFDVEDSTSVSDSQISHFFEFCGVVRRIRNRIESNLVDSTLICLQEKLESLQTIYYQQEKTLDEKYSFISNLEDTCKDLNGKVDEYRQDITSLQIQLSELTLASEEKEKKLFAARAELSLKLDQSVEELRIHLEQCQYDKMQSNENQVIALRESAAAAERVKAVEIQLLNTKALAYETLLLESKNEKRALMADNAMLEYEKGRFTSTIAYYTTLHEKDLTSILTGKKEIALLQESREKLEAAAGLVTRKYEETHVVISSLKDESRELTKQLVALQKQLLDRTDSAFAQSSKQDQTLYKDYLEKIQKLDIIKTQLEETEHAKLALLSSLEMLQLQLSTLEEKYSAKVEEITSLRAHLEILEKKCSNLINENTLIKDKIESSDAADTRKGRQQTISLLETRIDKSNSVAANTSVEHASYQEKLEEARRSQTSMMEKMIERESAWAKEKQELLLVKKNLLPSSNKRTMEQAQNEEIVHEPDVVKKIVATAPKKVKSKKDTDTSAPKFKKPKKTPAFAELDDSSVENQKPKMKPVKKSKNADGAPAVANSSTVQDILNAAQGQLDEMDSNSDERSEKEEELPKAKKRIKKPVNIIASTGLSYAPESSTTVTAPTETSKENNDPRPVITKEKVAKPSLFSKKAATTSAAPKLGGILSGFMKRPVTANPDSQEASIVPKIPLSYADQHRIDLLKGLK